MAKTRLTKQQKIDLTISIISLLTIFVFVEVINYEAMDYKCFENNYFRFCVEDGVEYCYHCERDMYLELKDKIYINKAIRESLNITTKYTSTLQIPREYLDDLIKVELFDAVSNAPINIDYRLFNQRFVRHRVYRADGSYYYDEDCEWVEFPYKKSDLYIGKGKYRYKCNRRFPYYAPIKFKVVADLKEGDVVSGKVKVNVNLFGQSLFKGDIDPIWWIAGKKYNITKLCNMKTVQQDIYDYVTHEYTCPTNYFNFTLDPKIAYCYNKEWVEVNQTYVYPLLYSRSFNYGYKPNKTIYWVNYEKIGEESVEVCDKKIGYRINNKIINCSKYGYGCDNKKTEVCIWYCLDGDCNTDLDFDYVKSRIKDDMVGGWSGRCFDIKNVNWHKVKMKLDSPFFKDLVIEDV